MFRKFMLILFVAMCVISIVSFNAFCDTSELNPTPDNPVTLRLGHTDRITWPGGEDPAPASEHAFSIMFKQYVESATNGAVKIEIFPNSVLGGAKQMVEMVKSGTLDLCAGTGVLPGIFPKFELINIPYAFQSTEIAWWVFDNSKFWKDLMGEMERETGIVCLGMGQNGVRNFTNNIRTIHEPADMKGLKFRVMESPIFVKMVDGLGANAIPIAWEELYTSLQTGVVDGQENPISVITEGKLYEVQKYLIIDEHAWSEDFLVMNSKKFHNFPEDIQQIIKIAGRIGAVQSRAAEELRTRITEYPVVAKNMEIYKPTAAEIKKFKEKAQPVVIDYLKNIIGEEVINDFFEAIDEAEEVLGYK